jgi:hypothetical protein
MQDETWIKTLEDGRKVKFIYLELPDHGAFITAQLAGNEVVYSIVLTEARIPLSREDVESHFKGELTTKEHHSTLGLQTDPLGDSRSRWWLHAAGAGDLSPSDDWGRSVL